MNIVKVQALAPKIGLALSKNNVVWLLSAVIVVIAFTFVYQRGQDQNWDLLNYHYFAGYSLLHGRFVHDIAPVHLQSFLNPTANILAYLPLAHLAFPVSAWVILSVQLLSLPILVLIARQIGRDLGCPQFGVAEFLALALCLLAPLWWSELGTTFFSSTTTPIVLLGLYFGFQGNAQGEKVSNLLILSGFLFGLSVGLKLTNVPFAIGFFVAQIVVSIRFHMKQALWQLLKLSIGMVVGFLITAWWNIYLLQRWGSPLFPLYNAWLKSPYFDQINFRDTRWQFSSIADFGRYVWVATTGTAKTSEIIFADARLIIFFALTPLALLVRKSGTTGKGTLLFMLFFSVSFFLWGVMLAYQRYLIPIEILFGFGIWILLSRITPNSKLLALFLAGCVIISAVFTKIPDWGHSQSRGAQSNPFGLQLPNKVTSTPARYLVVGNPIGYILPFLHSDSRFYGLGFSSQVDTLICAKVIHNDALPLRILSSQASALSIWNTLTPFGFSPYQNILSCSHFRSNIDSYVICEISRRTQEQTKSFSPINIDFRGSSSMFPSEVLGISGLSVNKEPWGRWSDGDEVVVKLANCLPTGKLRIDLRGHAFGPNIGRPVMVTLGLSKISFVFAESDRDLTATVENREQCQNTLSILVPKKTSPRELGISEDSRLLGVGLAQLNIRTDQ